MKRNDKENPHFFRPTGRKGRETKGGRAKDSTDVTTKSYVLVKFLRRRRAKNYKIVGYFFEFIQFQGHESISTAFWQSNPSKAGH